MARSRSFEARHLVIPGQVIATSTGEGEGGFLRGHGTYIEGSNGGGSDTNTHNTNDNESGQADPDSSGHNNTQERLIASTAGTMERVNKLISVHPFAPNVYSGQVGDLIVGRISSVGQSRWKVNLGSGCREATLPLSGVNLPYGVQRMRTAEDALGMRQLFREGDLLSAEVQQVAHSDGVLSLHTRSLKYGKLENGCVVQVYPSLIPRMKQHFATLEGIGVDVLLGTNGFIWIQRTLPKEWSNTDVRDDDARPLAETLQMLRQKHATTPILPDERANIARIRNVIEALKLVYCQITPDAIMEVYEHSKQFKVAEILNPSVVYKITQCTRTDST